MRRTALLLVPALLLAGCYNEVPGPVITVTATSTPRAMPNLGVPRGPGDSLPLGGTMETPAFSVSVQQYDESAVLDGHKAETITLQTCAHDDLDGQHVFEWRNWLLVDQDLRPVSEPQDLPVVVGYPDEYRFPALSGQCFGGQIAFERSAGARYAMFTDDGGQQAAVWRLTTE